MVLYGPWGGMGYVLSGSRGDTMVVVMLVGYWGGIMVWYAQGLSPGV